MPVIVDLLLLDEASRASTSHSSQVATARGLYAELERQLQESNSHLKRKSALGALIGRGASVRFIGHEDLQISKEHQCLCKPAVILVGDDLPVRPEAPAVTDSPALEDDCGRAEPLTTSASSQSPSLSRKLSPLPRGSKGIATVPRITDFPRNRSRPPIIPLDGLELLTSLFSWMPSCAAPVSCKSLEAGYVDTCTVVVAPPETSGLCIPKPANARWQEDPSDAFEAGLGGWPLCVPRAYAAVLHPASTGVAESCGVAGAARGAAGTVRSLHGARFRRAAVEVDDAELAIILAPLHDQRGGSASSSAPSPSTVSTVDSSASSASSVPGMTGHSRIIFAREGVSSVKLWPKLDDPLCAPPEDNVENGAANCSWPYMVEVGGIPHGSLQALTVMLALQSSSLASRLHDGLGRFRQSAGAGADGQSTPGVVRCELRINAKLTLHSAGNEVNCAAVVRRGICEACHVGADRVRVCNLRVVGEGGSCSNQATLRDLVGAPASSPSDAEMALASPRLPASSEREEFPVQDAVPAVSEVVEADEKESTLDRAAVIGD
mmetsp:Transcript_96912/g.269595  ORF Transcript_96912/g.269595 Transcript_96912/m.269595 type:complete len:550 (-) Transcript_96912:106-1755(-)|eukprot:CAMPEP_0179099736 /NCGR_PEP_ID=MMETSP0796-20121207/46026_1 /TAXON_ID=73915 /ORGANISM="Pyrodinium bahamense, Strain pbaha01" /LENGTH=549 /DNA_ID=CAMNT_0020797541 /DNA_START=74 /DNA_END=1723 /DNA_ORIENTATION=+